MTLLTSTEEHDATDAALMYPSPDTLLSEQRLSLFDRGARGAVPTLKSSPPAEKCCGMYRRQAAQSRPPRLKTRVFAGSRRGRPGAISRTAPDAAERAPEGGTL